MKWYYDGVWKDHFIPNNTQINSDLLSKGSEFASGNLAMSPASISLALSMLWGGARGETAREMAQVLHLAGAASAATGVKAVSETADANRPAFTTNSRRELRFFSSVALQLGSLSYGCMTWGFNSFEQMFSAGRKHVL